MNSNKVVYSLTVGDIQSVAEQELERDLSSKEIEKVIKRIPEKISWHDAIADSISENHLIA